MRYRDCLRDNGIDGLIAQLCAEAPSFRNETDAIDELRKWHSNVGRLGDYDIQCHGIDEDFEVLGRTFHGLQDMRSRVEMYARENYRDLHVFTPKEPVDSPDGLHVGLLFMVYPKFDIYDECDSRSYDNYIIRREEITNSDMERLSKVPGCISASRMHEMIPTGLLPILYYGGQEDYVLLATKKE